MNNIYIFGITGVKGGIESLMKYLIFDLLDDYNPKCINIVTSFEHIAFEDEYKKAGINIIQIPFRKQRAEYKERLNMLVSSFSNDDVAYLNISSYCNWSLFNIIKKAKCKIVVHGHNSFTSNILKKVIHKIGRNRFKSIGTKVAVSEECNSFMFAGGCDYIVYNGIKSDSFYFNLTDREQARKTLQINNNQLVIGCVGRILKEKNQVELIKMAKKYDKYLFVFVGAFTNTTYGKRITKIAPSNCVFAGQSENVGFYLSSFDALFIPSKHEAFSLAAVEGITNDLCVLYFKELLEKLPDIIKNHKNSFVFDPNKIESEMIDWHNKRSGGVANKVEDFDIKRFLADIRRIVDGQ